MKMPIKKIYCFDKKQFPIGTAIMFGFVCGDGNGNQVRSRGDVGIIDGYADHDSVMLVVQRDWMRSGGNSTKITADSIAHNQNYICRLFPEPMETEELSYEEALNRIKGDQR